ncbi:MAG: hypothetical protein AAB706_00570 [Patescibacteria group bacterium]
MYQRIKGGLEEDMKNQKVLILLISVLFIVSLLFGGMVGLLIKQTHTPTNKNYPEARSQVPKISFDGISPSEKTEIIDMINSLKPIYSSAMEEIHFTTNQGLVNGICDDSCWGVNHRYVENGAWHSEIYIYVDENMTRVKQTLCHEITHQFIKPEEYFHKFAYDLASEGVCYE